MTANELDDLIEELVRANRHGNLEAFRNARDALRAYVRGPIQNDDDYADAVVRCDEYKRRTKPHRRLPQFRLASKEESPDAR